MQAYILDALRTPVVPSGGKFNALVVRHLAAPVVATLMKRQQISPLEIEQFIMGNALNTGGNPARVVALQAGLSEATPAMTIDTNCNSGIDAVIMGAEKIRAGVADIVIAGGAESVSRRPIKAYRPIDSQEAPIEYDRPSFTPWQCADPSMLESAERCASDGQISQRMQREWLEKSIDKAMLAKERLSKEKCAFNESGIVNSDEKIEFGQTGLGSCLEDASALLVENADNKLTHAPTADAAAFVVMVSERWLKQHNREASARLLDTKTLGSAADDPSWAIIDSCRAIMDNNDVSPNNFSAFEIAETYAAQVLYCIDELGLDRDLVNLAGGDLARGNAIAAGSAVLLVRLFHEIKAMQAGELGLATSAAAGGIGSAVIMQAC